MAIDNDAIQTIVRQNDVIISLLARLDDGANRIREAVTRGKRAPEAYVRLYNALNGTIGVSECAKVAKVTPGTVSVILKNWEQQGIVYDVGGKGKPLYKKILVLPKKEDANG